VRDALGEGCLGYLSLISIHHVLMSVTGAGEMGLLMSTMGKSMNL